MISNQILYALTGGTLIGLAVTLMLLFNGRVTGVSGIVANALAKPTSQGMWRWMFLAGLLAGGFLLHANRPELFVNESGRSASLVVAAGFLVGYGTVMANGCTSGHGVCGLSRFSMRSGVATFTFMLFGFLTVQAVRFFVAGSP